MTELFILVVVTILSVYAAVRLHEILHYLVARALHYQACFKHVGVLAFQVEYRNKSKPSLRQFLNCFYITISVNSNWHFNPSKLLHPRIEGNLSNESV